MTIARRLELKREGQIQRARAVRRLRERRRRFPAEKLQVARQVHHAKLERQFACALMRRMDEEGQVNRDRVARDDQPVRVDAYEDELSGDRKSTRLNSSH